MKNIPISTLFLAFVFSALPACKNRDFNNSSQQKNIENGAYSSVTPDRITYGFHWTSSPSVTDLNSAIAWAKFQIDESKENAKIPENGPAPEMAAAGHGLYIATDPMQSDNFGSNLLLVPVKPQSKFTYIFERSDSSQFSVMRSNTPMIVYRYISSFVPGALDRSAVIRSPDLVDWNAASFYTFKRGKLEVPDEKGIEKLKLALDSKDLKQFLEFFLNSRKTLETLCSLADTTQTAKLHYIKTELNNMYNSAMFHAGANNEPKIYTVIQKELKEPGLKELVEKQPLPVQAILLQSVEKPDEAIKKLLNYRASALMGWKNPPYSPGETEITFDFDLYLLKKIKLVPQDLAVKSKSELLDFLYTAAENKLKEDAKALAVLQPLANQFSGLLTEMSLTAWK